MRAKAVISDRGFLTMSYGVSIEWDAPVDRPNSGGWIVGTKSLAERLAACVDAQAAHEGAAIRTDVNGRSYVAWTSRLYGRELERDLRKLGF